MPDKFSKAVRSRIMAAIKSKNTGPERAVFAALRARGIRFRKHYKGVPGTPDVAWPARKIAVFLDGDFWHGWRYPAWKKSISLPFWRKKIEGNRARDRRNFAALRSRGWKVLRVWEHEIKRDLDGTVESIIRFIKPRKGLTLHGEKRVARFPSPLTALRRDRSGPRSGAVC